MMSKELVPYSEAHRDSLEEELTVTRNKLNMEERNSNGMRVIMYLLRKEGVITIWCYDERTNASAEYPVPPEEAYDWFRHAFAHKDAILEPLYDGYDDGA